MTTETLFAPYKTTVNSVIDRKELMQYLIELIDHCPYVSFASEYDRRINPNRISIEMVMDLEKTYADYNLPKDKDLAGTPQEMVSRIHDHRSIPISEYIIGPLNRAVSTTLQYIMHEGFNENTSDEDKAIVHRLLKDQDIKGLKRHINQICVATDLDKEDIFVMSSICSINFGEHLESVMNESSFNLSIII